MNEQMVCVGAIGGSYGVKGDARIKSFCADPRAIADYGPLTTEDGQREFSISLKGTLKAGFAARLSNVNTKEQADALKGVRLYAPREALPDLPDEEYYHADLIGMIVLDTGGKELGKVSDVMNHGADDLLEVRGKGIKDDALIPFTREIVPTVDMASGRIIIDPPEGLL